MKVRCYSCSADELPKNVPLTPREQESMENGTWPWNRTPGYYCPVCGNPAEPVQGDQSP